MLFHRYVPQSEVDAVLEGSKPGQTKDGKPEEAKQNSATPQPENQKSGGADQRKDEPGSSQGGEAAAA
jgi:hypothetical protein